MKEWIYDLIIGVLIFSGGCLIGWLYGEYQDIRNNDKLFDGFRIGNIDKNGVYERALERDGKGNWVCLNVKGMVYKDIIDTCIHEASHELFARNCEKNSSKCLEIFEK